MNQNILSRQEAPAGVLSSIHRGLRPGGSFLPSVVTDKFTSEISGFTSAFRQILSGFLQMDIGCSTGSGLVFRCSRNGL